MCPLQPRLPLPRTHEVFEMRSVDASILNPAVAQPMEMQHARLRF